MFARSEKKPSAIAEGLSAFRSLFGYAALIASTGQVASHAPQSVQVFASIWYLLSPALMASTGQTLSQAPHIVQSSEIL
jgi:hypothetical protein